MKIYVLVNDKVERDFQLVPSSTVDIASRSSIRFCHEDANPAGALRDL
jgi:hypothetical protein